MVSCIIPAFDEAGTIAQVIDNALRHPWIDEVLVVDDGSADTTALAAEAAGARVIRLEKNTGKTAAMDTGVRAARSNIILFLDADVTGHTRQTLSQIMQPVIDGRHEMFVGLRARSTMILNRALRFFPIISGDRALTRQLWEAIPTNQVSGFEIEIALNYTSKQFEKGMSFALVHGTSHRIKERKYGLLVGISRRLVMIGHVLSISFRLYVLGGLRQWALRIRQRLTANGRTSINS